MRSKRAARNIVTNLLLQIVIIVYGFIVPKIIISKFGSEVNGLIASITQFLAYITLFESGFGPIIKAAFYRPIAKKDETEIASILMAAEKIFRKISYILVCYIIVLCIAFPLIIDSKFDALFTIPLIVIIGISTFAEYFFGMTYRLFLQSKQKTYIVSTIQISTYVLSIAIIIIFARIGASIQVIKLASGLVFALRPLIQNYYVKKKYKINFSEADSNYRFKQKWDALAQHIASVIHSNTDIVVLTLFSTLSEVSVYSVYYLIVSGTRKIAQSFSLGLDASFGDMIAKKEKTNLRQRFSTYELFYSATTTIVFSTAIILANQFIAVYTKGIDDVDYIRPLFGCLLVISEYIWAIRQPYNELTKAAGHFKETRKGALVECISNILISIVLVGRFGIVGVAIGTIVAMTIRTIEFVYHVNKYILKRSIWESAKKILLVTIETIIIVLLCNFLPYRENTDYLNWGINALMTFLVASIVVLSFNCIFFRKELSDIKSLFKSILHCKTSTK